MSKPPPLPASAGLTPGLAEPLPPLQALSPSVMRCASPTAAASSRWSASLATAPWSLRPTAAMASIVSPLNNAGRASPRATARASPRAPAYVRSRRTAVSSEPLEEDLANWTPPHYPKSAAEFEWLKEIVVKKLNLLFQMANGNEERIVNAMYKIPVEDGQELIRQGDEGDNFYVVASGAFDIFVSRPGVAVPQLVLQVGPGGSFGELALMYNAPRAATVRATRESVCWAMDRKCFRQLVVKACVIKKQKHEELLNKVTIFRCLTKLELVQLSEILQVQKVAAGETVIQQGNRGDRFYLVESGELVCRMAAEGQELEVMRYSSGGFFGELALISDFGVRKASVVAVQPSVLLWIGKSTFDRVLGPIIDTLRRNAHRYPSYADLVARSERRRA